MCGIIGYVGRQEAAPILLEGLERMEYRGYDSTGMAVCGDGVLRVCKKKGRVQVLREMSHDGADLPGTLGIGHTRWATHGEPSDVNAHPHLSQSGKFAVVHNGIIENFIALKEELLQKGYTFRSETDTEVVAQLLDYYYSDCGDFFEAMNRLLHAVDGAYALGIICADYPDRLVAARKDAPLLLGFGDGENFIASDVTALIRHTRDIAYMDDGELAILSRSGIRVYDRQLRPVEKKHHHVDWEVDAAEKGGYAHFMLKEIMEQPAAIRKATAARIQGGRVVLQDLTMTPEQIRAIGRIYIVACGSSYHVGMVGKYNLERMLRRSVEVCLASEFRYCDPIVGEGDLVIVISQSGETLDTMAALREAKKRGARILSIVNVVGSSIARESDDVLYTWAGPEIAVATTKAYSTQMAVLNLLGLYFGEVMGTVDYETYTAMIRDILDLPEKLEEIRYVKFEDAQQKLYDAQVVHMKEKIAQQNEGEFNKNKLWILAELTKLRQICCSPSLCFENYRGEAAKLEGCMQLIQSAMDGGHRMLLFSQFTSMLAILQDKLEKEGIPYYIITGETSKQKRQELVKQFNSDTTPVFLISLKAGGVGLNLTGADVVIHYDPWWNQAVQNQATDRAHRIGQTKK